MGARARSQRAARRPGQKDVASLPSSQHRATENVGCIVDAGTTDVDRDAVPETGREAPAFIVARRALHAAHLSADIAAKSEDRSPTIVREARGAIRAFGEIGQTLMRP